MMYISISRNWLFSPMAQRVYLLCALLNLALIATRIGVFAAMTAAGVSSFSAEAGLFVKVLFFPEIIGTAILFVGMSYCWLGFGGSYKRKLLWIIFIRFFVVMAPIYYFLEYRSLASREASKERVRVAPGV
jgi:hypothetical protein